MIHSLTFIICYMDSERYKLLWSEATSFSCFSSREKRVVFVERNPAPHSLFPKKRSLFLLFPRFARPNLVTQSIFLSGLELHKLNKLYTMPVQTYSVPLVLPSLRREESINQIVDSLEYLEEVSKDILHPNQQSSCEIRNG